MTIGQFGVTRKIDEEKPKSWRVRVARILDELDKFQAGLLITVDEIDSSIDDMRSLVSHFQHLVGERRQIALIMAGLPYKVSLALRDDRITFLRRAFQHRLDPIAENEVILTMRETIEDAGRKISKDALFLAAENAKGFPFMIQLIGYHVWVQRPSQKNITFEDAEYGVRAAESDMRKMIFEATMLELSNRDRDFLVAMSEDENISRIADIAERMGVTTKYAGQYRRRLIEQGLIGDRGVGRLGFELPMLREYLIENKVAIGTYFGNL